MVNWTTSKLIGLKGKRKITVLTAYDYPAAKLIDEAGIPVILVGDSLGMTVLGYDSTVPVTMEQMLHHVKAVTRAVKQSLVIADMPFGSYQNPSMALANATRFMKEAGAHAVKLEGGKTQVEIIRCLRDNGIPVCGHIGLTPQHVHALGGYRVQGRGSEAAEKLKKDARALQDAGVFAMVLEVIPKDLAAEITEEISVPTIGIGAGPDCDGQVLVLNDLLGQNSELHPKFVKAYADIETTMREAFSQFRKEVEGGDFPETKHSYD